MRSFVLAALVACNTPPPQTAANGAGPAEPPLAIEREVVFEGMCDASGAVEIDARTFVVADDEDNVLRVYDAQQGGPPLAEVDVSQDVGLVAKGKKLRFPELDLEAATRIGDRAYWITSHGRNSAGKLKPERMRFFATTLPESRDDLRVVQVTAVADGLLDELLADPRFEALGLRAAAELAPKAPGGLNLEGMTAGPDGRLLLGLRNPVPDGLAILFAIDGPEQVLAGERGAISGPIRLDLGGLGVRALTWWRGRYLIVAGHFDSGGPTSRLYAWDGDGAARPIDVDLSGYNPEATFSPEDGLMLLSDDGTVEIDGVPCKDVEDRARRRFRGTWLAART